MKLRFLGTGTSFGVPVVGCRCDVCTSPDARDRRTRHAALLTGDDDRRLLIDTPPDLRQQLLDAETDRIDAVWYTHEHADHTHGIDDLRVFSARNGPVPLHAGVDMVERMERRFSYIFDPEVRPHAGTTRPELRFFPYDGNEPVRAAGFTVQPLPVPHGDTPTFGLRVGGLGYITDAKFLPDDVIAKLRGVRVLVLNALWFGSPHPTHFNVEEALAAAEQVGAEYTYLTHLTHRMRHAEMAARLPAGVAPAYDGLTIEIEP
ncbi:MAG TPA: MBL fold metallo-hydrolase [Longimicrobiales bacterium]